MRRQAPGKALAERETLRQLQEIPNVGPATAGDLVRIGVRQLADAKGRDPDEMYEALCAIDGVRHDPCVRDVFAAIVSFAGGGRARPWWHFTAKRKARDRAMR